MNKLKSFLLNHLLLVAAVFNLVFSIMQIRLGEVAAGVLTVNLAIVVLFCDLVITQLRNAEARADMWRDLATDYTERLHKLFNTTIELEEENKQLKSQQQ